MTSRSVLIISLMPLMPIKCGMQNTVYLLYKYLKKKNFKVFFMEVETNNFVDPILNLNYKRSVESKIKKKIDLYKPNLIFVNTSKLLHLYKDLLLNEEKLSKTILVCHDLYHFRKKFFSQIKVTDKTYLSSIDEVKILKKVNYIIDYSKNEQIYMKNKNIDKKKMLNTCTPTKKFKKVIINNNQKFDILYISSKWLQNKINIDFFLKKINYKEMIFKFLIIGDILGSKKNLQKIKIKKYSVNNLKSSKLGIALMKSGTGRKTKIFEMLALGIPIFTNIDLSEYGLKNNKHYKVTMPNNSFQAI